MYTLVFYVPSDAAEGVKEAVFSTGAGRIGNYEACAWQTKGVGQFRPLAGSSPAIGSQDKLETVDELRVEMVCEDAKIHDAVRALVAAHPYETPAFHYCQIGSTVKV